MLRALISSLQLRTTSVTLAFIAEIYGEIGEGNKIQAAHDLRTLAQLAIVTSKSHSDIQNLGGAMTYIRAMQAYRYLTLQSMLDEPAIDMLTRDFPPAYSSGNSDPYEKFFALDTVMQAIRGDEQPLLRAMAVEFDPSVTIDHGDLQRANWTIVLRTVLTRLKEFDKVLALPRAGAIRQSLGLPPTMKRTVCPPVSLSP